jgi:hypothetical protein
VAATFIQPLLRGFRFDKARGERGISLRARELADTDLAAARAATTREVLHAYWGWVYARDFLAVQRRSFRWVSDDASGDIQACSRVRGTER